MTSPTQTLLPTTLSYLSKDGAGPSSQGRLWQAPLLMTRLARRRSTATFGAILFILALYFVSSTHRTILSSTLQLNKHSAQTYLLSLGTSRNARAERTLQSQMAQRLSYLQSRFTLHHLREDYQLLDVGAKDEPEDYGLEAYRKRLRTSYERYFAPQGLIAAWFGPHRDMWDTVESHLVPGRSPVHALESIPKNIVTSIRNKTLLPESFDRWREDHPSWNVSVYDSDDQEDYFRQVALSLGRRQTPGSRRTFLDEWLEMPYPVLQTDTYRYLKIFLEGGLWSDSDTGSTIPVEQWIGMSKPDPFVLRQDDEVLRQLEYMSALTHKDQVIPAASGATRGKGEAGPVDEAVFEDIWSGEQVSNITLPHTSAAAQAVHWTQPGFVTAIEWDAPASQKEWKQSHLARPLTLAQWTFMAKPYHPILLDALGTIMDFSQRYHAANTTKGPANGDDYFFLILDWTGE